MKAERSAIVGKLLAQMMVMSGFTQIITMDLHQKELQGFFDCPVDNLRASPFFINYIQQKVSLLKVESSVFIPTDTCSRFFSEVSPSSYLGQMEGLTGNSKPLYEVGDSKNEKSAPMYCFEGTPLRYSPYAWIMGLTNLAQ